MKKTEDYVLERQIGFIMRRAVQRHLSIFAALIPDMTPTQFAALAKLCELGQASQNELGRLSSMDVATIKGVVDRLRARKLVKASVMQNDKRRLVLSPTKKGQVLFEQYAPKAAKATQLTLAPLDKEDQGKLFQLLKRLV